MRSDRLSAAHHEPVQRAVRPAVAVVGVLLLADPPSLAGVPGPPAPYTFLDQVGPAGVAVGDLGHQTAAFQAASVSGSRSSQNPFGSSVAPTPLWNHRANSQVGPSP